METISQIAREIKKEWKPLYFAAVPYVNAMLEINSIDDTYGVESARGMVRGFLTNAQTWRGPKAREIKLKLNNLLKK